MTSKIPQLVGHRGWPEFYPENTLEGFAAAVNAGALWLECDVQLSADGVPFVIHDATLTRTAEINHKVSQMTAVDLAKVNVGERQRFGERFSNSKIPALATLADWLATQQQVKLFVEIKRQSLRHFGTDSVVRQVIHACQSALKQCIIISFDHDCLGLARSMGAPVVGWVTEEYSPHTARVIETLNPDYVLTSEEKFIEVHKALKCSAQWVVYETRDPQRALQLAAQGAGFVETNDIGTMLLAPELAAS